MNDPLGRRRGAPAQDRIAARFRTAYPRYQYAMAEFLTDHLVDVSRTFGGDLQQSLILAVLGQRHLQRVIDGEERSGGLTPEMTASRLADVTALPRETVRRKLQRLETRGWIERSETGAWRLALREDGTTRARADLAELDRRGLERGARLFAALGRLA